MKSKIILNCFPPTNLYMPAIACEVLKSYLLKHNINTEVVYWNHIFQDLYIDETENKNLFHPTDDIHKILPFLSILSSDYRDKDSITDQIIFKMQETCPSFKSIEPNYYENKLLGEIKKAKDIINIYLDKILTDDVVIFGVSAKFDSWVTGTIVAQEVKKRNPNIKCLLGGIEDEHAAKALFNILDVYDFVMWGEGEIPLKTLHINLETNNHDFSMIPRTLYRNEEVDKIIKNAKILNTKESYFDIKDYYNLDFDEYFTYANNTKKEDIILPIEISRGCRWNRCNFCALNWGYLYRQQDFDKIINQLRELYVKYKVKKFFFVDNDIVGKDIRKFEAFLDSLINLSNELEIDFDFHADILHLGFNKKIIKKLSLAGFKSVQVGYEAVSDSMLKKLNKSTTFADNILFVKFAQKFDVDLTITGLIIGIPQENRDDVKVSTNNLHYLRFFLGKEKNKLEHRFSELTLFYNTNFWKMMTDAEKEEFKKHPMNEYLSGKFTNNKYIRYSLLGQYRIPPQMDNWYSFKVISNHYENSNYKYYLIKDENIVHYIEYNDKVKTNSIRFDQPEYWDVLKLANDKVIGIKKIAEFLKENYQISESKSLEIVKELNETYLLYCSEDFSKIITIIDTDNC